MINHESVMGDFILPVPVASLKRLFDLHNGLEFIIQLMRDPGIAIFINGPYSFKYFYMDNEEYQNSVNGKRAIDIEGIWTIIAHEQEKLRTLVSSEGLQTGIVDIDLGENSIMFQLGGFDTPFDHYDLIVEAESQWEES